MHFVTGGAFQGKRKWVKEKYCSGKVIYLWNNGYEENSIYPTEGTPQIVVIEGCEMHIRRLLERKNPRDNWSTFIETWREWESAREGRTVVFIGCDIGGGIVPIEREKRQWRDMVGWCYQDTVMCCDQVDLVWAGLSQKLKG